jgi:pimeloyl-ACP methyl ester carboxylesterase
MRPRLVLLPGLDGTGRLFEPFVDAVGSQAPITVVDYASPEVARYADCRGVAERRLPHDEPFILVGESFSGPVAISIASTHPPGLRGLVLVGSFVSSPSPSLKYLSTFIPVVPTHSGPDWLRAFLLLGRSDTPALRRSVRDAMAKVTSRAVRTRLREIARVNVASELSAVRVPVLYLRATDDRLVPRSCGEEVVRLSRLATITEVTAPHLLLQCAPVECARLIADFASGCEATR